MVHPTAEAREDSVIDLTPLIFVTEKHKLIFTIETLLVSVFILP